MMVEWACACALSDYSGLDALLLFLAGLHKNELQLLSK